MMIRHSMIAVIGLFLVLLLTVSCEISTNKKVDQGIHSVTEPHQFSIVEWEFETLRGQLWTSLKPASNIEIDDAETVRQYFASIQEFGSASAALEEKAENILALQIRTTLINEGIIHPLDNWIPTNMVFPAINFKFQDPPHLLVISPKEEIRLLSRTVLEPNMNTADKEMVEQDVDLLGYSSLVTNLGGVGFTYPTMVYKTSDIHHAIEIIVEEWFHQYMAFKPLGWRYVLDIVGWKPDYDIITMNETVAGIVSGEISDIVYQKYYHFGDIPEQNDRQNAFNFRLEMRQIRIAVDEFLANGEVEQAETYMNEMRDFLATNGYHIRKLNQAYFAFHGNYADDSTTVSPIGQDLQELRKRSPSLRAFLDNVSKMTDYEDIQNALEESKR